MWIKQRTFDCEQALTRWAEPLTLWSELLRARLGETWLEPPLPPGPPSPSPHEVKSDWGLLDRAWRLLLENQPHDSICGCSIDQTHDEMRPRFDQCEQVAEDLTQQAMRRIGAQGLADRVYVFNPLPGPRTDYVTTTCPRVRERRASRADRRQGQATRPAVRTGCPAGAARRQPAHHDRLRRSRRAVRSATGRTAWSTGLSSAGRASARQARLRSSTTASSRSVPIPKDGSLRVEVKGTGVQVQRPQSPRRWRRPRRRVQLLRDRPRPARHRARRAAEGAPDRGRAGAPDARDHDDVSAAREARTTSGSASRRRSPVRCACSSASRPACRASTSAPSSRTTPRTTACARTSRPACRATSRTPSSTSASSRARSRCRKHDKTWCEVPSGYEPQKTFVDINDGKGGMMIANRGLPEYEALPGRAQRA